MPMAVVEPPERALRCGTMRTLNRESLRRRRAKRRRVALAKCPTMRDHAVVSRKQLRTSNYSAEARAVLGKAVEDARIAAGYKYRTDFCRANNIKNLRGLEYLEHGKTGVGQVLLFEVADALPGWDRDTPRIILEGGPVPANADDEEEPVPAAADLDLEFRMWPLDDQIKYDYLVKKLAELGLRLTPERYLSMKDQAETEYAQEKLDASPVDNRQ